jgi:hypothetical protein
LPPGRHAITAGEVVEYDAEIVNTDVRELRASRNLANGPNAGGRCPKAFVYLYISTICKLDARQFNSEILGVRNTPCPYISHGPLIFWIYPVFGLRGATYFLGVAEWLFCALLLLGFWNKKLGILGALGSCFSFIATFTIIRFMPDGWAASAGGFPAMTERVAFLMKDLVLFAASFYLIKQDLMKVSGKQLQGTSMTGNKSSAGVGASQMPKSA